MHRQRLHVGAWLLDGSVCGDDAPVWHASGPTNTIGATSHHPQARQSHARQERPCVGQPARVP
jgi:hypothetical protein